MTEPIKAYRQGDVILKIVGKIPKGTKPVPHLILAEGEVTGHKHQVIGDAKLYPFHWGHRYLEIKSQSVLVHEEHGPILLDPGFYEVAIQREYESPMIDHHVSD